MDAGKKEQARWTSFHSGFPSPNIGGGGGVRSGLLILLAWSIGARKADFFSILFLLSFLFFGGGGGRGYFVACLWSSIR